MKKTCVLAAAFCLLFCYQAHALEGTEAESRLKGKPLTTLAEKQFLFSSYYEMSWIKLAGRKDYWRLFTNTLAYSFDNGLVPYLEIDAWDRLHDHDQLVSLGSYLKFKDSSFLHSEISFGNDITYVPRFRATQEYQRRFIQDIFWQFGYRYLNHPEDDVNIVYPGLVYYFKDHYLSLFYNASFTESRGTAQWGTIRGNFAVNDRLNLWLGTAAGERLYDIELLKASKQYGYILFLGTDFKLYKELKMRLGFSYSKENPDFIKRSLDYGLSFKF